MEPLPDQPLISDQARRDPSTPMPSVSSSIRRHLDLIALNLGLLLVASVLAERSDALYRNSLAQHPEWQSTKPLLSKAVMGAKEFVKGRQALVHNRLYLKAWLGFQEVLYRQALNVVQLDVGVRFEPEGYINILYDVRPDGFSGVRFSDRRDLPSIQFRASPEGEFRSVAALALSASASPDVVHAVRVRFEPHRATIFLDGRPVGSFDRTEGPQQIGFRGGQRAAWVDDVVLRLTDGTTIRESFSNTRHELARTLTLFCLGAVAIGFGGLLVGWGFSFPARSTGLGTAIVGMGLIALASCAYVFAFLAPRPYPVADSQMKLAAAKLRSSTTRQRLAELRREYGGPAGGNAYRILFLGSSQTWGSGATTPDEVWVEQLERMLNTNGRQRYFACMNAGISGLMSPQALAILRDLLPLGPQAAVIDLSSNDTDTAAFRANLDTMVATLTHAKIRAVLLLEPNSPERRVTDSRHGPLSVKHGIIAEVGKAYGIPVIDLQRYLAEKNQAGFLWWDFVHLTSFGQRLVAEKLYADLPAALRFDSIRTPHFKN